MNNSVDSHVLENPSNISIQTQMQNLFERLSPNLWVMISTLIALVILLVVLTYLVYKPVKKMLAERKKFIQDNIDASVKSREKALEFEKEKQKELLESKTIAFEIVRNAKIESEKIIWQYTENAKKEYKKILDSAAVAINLKEQQFREQAKQEVVEIGTEIASKILEKKVTPQTESEIIKKILDKA
ncbi:F0F1 ATP synthase subunit B [Mycoplasma iguanae]|uniref:ATP synthase subunit b n=1 Tax=Mycoplasma iguanae TaxID=292461 RepID=A0ABY5RAP6_9MOLU|nr:F0F1 ATP synthase subunit B [Mycoplasma iguanae]UVD81849.1 F0F1 ATP synthase subunit B [Mycoplasma iguanae]